MYATSRFDEEYLRVLKDILDNGTDSEDRTGTGRRRLFAQHMAFDISKEFPLLTTKKVNYKAVINEFLWMVVNGSTDVGWLQERGHTFWNEWALSDNTIGKGYGHQFRNCKGVDQVQSVIDSIKNEPYSTRHVISLWQPDELKEMALVPCHGVLIEFFVDGNHLNCHMTQRSGDFFLGVPWNIAFYSLFTKVVAQLTGLNAGIFSHMIVDAHIYLNHIEQAQEQINRTPLPYPTISINSRVTDINDFVYESFTINGYNPLPAINAPISV